jgi:hypothetical protein
MHKCATLLCAHGNICHVRTHAHTHMHAHNVAAFWHRPVHGHIHVPHARHSPAQNDDSAVVIIITLLISTRYDDVGKVLVSSSEFAVVEKSAVFKIPGAAGNISAGLLAQTLLGTTIINPAHL